MLRKISIIGLGIISLSSFTQANDVERYAGASFAVLDYSESGFDDASLNALIGRAGAKFNEYISAEVRLGFGIGDDTVSGVDLELKNLIGAYVRAGFPASDTVYPYVVIGLSRLELEASGFGVTIDDSDNDASYGLGVDIDVSEAATLNAEYTNYFDKDSIEITAFNFGATFNF